MTGTHRVIHDRQFTVAAEPWDDEDGARLRAMQRAELDARYGCDDHEPGSAPTSEDITVFLVARDSTRVRSSKPASRPVEVRRREVS